MLAEKVTVALIVLTILSTSHQEDLPLQRNIIKHDKLLQDHGNKTRTRKFSHENTSTLQEDTIRNISNRMNNGIAKHVTSRNEQDTLKAESAGGSDGTVKGKSSSTEDDDEDKKTLSQQVSEGKYGLIHTELFQTVPKRPGILTYKVNPEVPKDNVNNLGGLEEEEIWLAENHLLVLAGGGYSKKGQNWPPIDDYNAPRRQVKIPPNPKVPPPFPIQLHENGPIEIIRGVNGSIPRPLPFFPPSAAELNVSGMFPFFPPPPPGFSPGNFTPGNGPPFPFPFPQLPNGSIPELPPFSNGFRGPPPGAPFPPINWTDLIDEDDPSIYYPPPYDFYFPKDNSSYVPAGPLVPGIVLPPPPDFFAPYDNATKPTKTKLSKGPVIKKVKYQPPKQYFDTQSKLPDIDNSLNTLTTPMYYYKTSTAPTRPTKPSLQTINDYPATDEITNEVTPSSRENQDDWVPIPAPRPYYITGPAKPLKENVLVIMSTPKQETDTNGYDYEVPTKSFKLPEQNKFTKENSIPDFYNQNNLNTDNHVYADEPMGKQYRPVTRKPKLKPKSTVAPAQTFHGPVRTGGKSLQATYYFYEDPSSDEEVRLTPPKPNRPLRPTPPPVPPPTSAPIVDFYAPKEPVHIKPRPISVMNTYNALPPLSPINPYEPRNPTTSTTMRPSLLDYFYYNGEKNGGYNFMVPDGQPGISPKSTSRPIFEYSYTAPGYKDETKKANGMDYYFNSYPSTVTTSKPTDFLFSYDNYLSTSPAPPHVHVPHVNEIFSTTPKPSHSPTPPSQVFNAFEPPTTTQRVPDRYNYQRTSTQKPWRDVSGRKPLNPLLQTTPHPFYAFFTHQDESLVDDITKKYFTFFGQKIRPSHESTTPLNEVQSSKQNINNFKYNNFESSKEVQYSDGVEQNKGSSQEYNNYNNDESSANHNQNSQENINYNYDNIRQVHNHNYDSRYPSSHEQLNHNNYYQENYNNNNYNLRGNPYKNSASTEDPNYNYKFSKNSLSTSFRTTTVKPKTQYSYQQAPKRPSQVISLSNSFNVERDKKKPSLDYDYDYDYDKHPEPSLHDDTQVNYKRPYHKDYDSEWLPMSQQYHQEDTRDNNQFISYKLPGNGNGHFFFLTPQAVQLEELANAFLFPSNVETRNNFYNKRNTGRMRRKPDESSTQSMREKQKEKKLK